MKFSERRFRAVTSTLSARSRNNPVPGPSPSHIDCDAVRVSPTRPVQPSSTTRIDLCSRTRLSTRRITDGETSVGTGAITMVIPEQIVSTTAGHDKDVT